MKIIFTFFSCRIFLMLLSCFAIIRAGIAQSAAAKALVLNYDNYIVPPTADYSRQGANGGVAVPETGSNIVWDYGSLVNNDLYSVNLTYAPAISNYFTSARRQTNFIFQLGEMPIQQTGYESDDVNAFSRLGRSIVRQAFPIGELTGFLLDSLVISQQDVADEGTLEFVTYPCTTTSAWSSSARASTAFQLSMAIFGLDHTPGEFIQRQTLTRSVVGSGKMRIPGADKKINVLMVRSVFTNIDSVYLAGFPAPPEILAAFGLTQGQETNVYEYVFIRAGIDEPLISFNMNADFSAINFIQYDAAFANIYCGNKNEFVCSGETTYCLPFADVTPLLLNNNTATIGACNNNKYVSNQVDAQNALSNNSFALVYPNPSAGAFHLRFNTDNMERFIRVLDLTGKTLSQFSTREREISFGAALKPGIYFAEIREANTKKMIRLVKQ